MANQLIGQPLIDRLKEEGWAVKVEHRRLSTSDGIALRKGRPSHDATMRIIGQSSAPRHKLKQEGREISPHGGMTVVEAVKGPVRIVARAICSPHDNFNRRAGLTRATGRLLSQLRRL